MKRTYLFLVLISSTLAVPIMAGQRSEDARESETWPFKAFVSRCRDAKLTERMSEYRAKINDLVKQGKVRFYDYAGVYNLIQEIARQGDFESLELLEKDLPSDLKEAAWKSVSANANTDDANKLLVKWAMENPTVPILIIHHPNCVNLLIERAEDSKAPMDDRVSCLNILARMRATNVLDRIKALMSDKSICCFQGLSNNLDNLPKAFTLGTVAAETVRQLEAIKMQK
jgi:hypothetical protein